MKAFPTYFAIVLTLAAAKFAWADQPTAADLDRQIQALRSRYSVEVHYRFNPAADFPRRWRENPISARGEPASLAEASRLLPIVARFLSQHPPGVLKKNLTDVYLVGRLECFGKRYGGTSSASAIYVQIRGGVSPPTDAFLMGRLHSEFSSILFRNHPFPWDRWQRVNAAGFSYPRSSLAFLDQRGLYSQDSRLLKQGFVVKYAQSSLENDFNMITDWLFTRPSQLSTLAGNYRRIGAKQELAVRFYKSIDARYDFYSGLRPGSY